MPRKRRYQVGDQIVTRKHNWLPCALNDRLDGASDGEIAAALKATWWADLITASEWPALLRLPEGKAPNRSKLKRKLVGWLMASGRIAALDPQLFDQAVREARDLYRQQLGEQHPLMVTIRNGEYPGDWLFHRFDPRPTDGQDPPAADDEGS